MPFLNITGHLLKKNLVTGSFHDIISCGSLSDHHSCPSNNCDESLPFFQKQPVVGERTRNSLKKNIIRKSVKLFVRRILFLLRGCLLCLLCFRLLCRCLLCCCHVGIHLLPERVIFFLNLRINKYFGRKGFFTHRNAPNHHFFACKMIASEQNRINKAFRHEMRNWP